MPSLPPRETCVYGAAMHSALDADPVPTIDGHDTALFLDIDGTLLDIAPVPEAVVVPPALRDSLSSLYESLGGALAIVSGRPIAQIDQLFKPLRLPASGEHGFETRRVPTEPIEELQPPPALLLLRPTMTELAREMPGVLPEFKSGTIALHFRQVPDTGPTLLARIEEAVAPYSDALMIQPGKMVFEIKPRAVDKGRAIMQLMMAPPFLNRRPIFVGDDATDEYGFAAVRSAGGHAIRVGPSPGESADACIATPAHVRAWLQRMAMALAARAG